MKIVDVLIIGGGPAGLAAGLTCARRGLSTLLCERRRFPVDKACGEGLMPTGVAHLRALGVDRYLEADEYHPFTGIRYISASGRSAAAAFREGPGWGISRRALSSALVAQSRAQPHLEICEGAPAEPVRREAGRVWVRIENELAGARLLVGADGLNSTVRRWAGLEGGPARFQRWGARQHFAVAPWSPYVEVYWRPGVEAYITPVGSSLVNVAFLWDRKRFRQVEGGAGLIPSLLSAFPQLQAHLRGAAPVDAALAVGPLQRQAAAPAAAGVVLVGDAAGYLDAITGEGLSLALAQAAALETTVIPYMLSGESLERMPDLEVLAGWRAAYARIARPYLLFTHLLLWLSRHPLLFKEALRLLDRRPDLFQHLLSANMGSGWYASKPRSAGR